MDLKGKSIVKFAASVSAVLMLLMVLSSGAFAAAEQEESPKGECPGDCLRACLKDSSCNDDVSTVTACEGCGLQVKDCIEDCDGAGTPDADRDQERARDCVEQV